MTPPLPPTPPNLDTFALFADLPRSVKAAITECARWLTVPGGSTIFQAGEPASALFIVLTGALVAHRASPEGEVRLIGHIRAGEPVGEMALIAGGPHTATVSALRDSEVFLIERADFERLNARYPALLAALSRLMLTRAREGARGPSRSDPRVFAVIATSRSIDLEGRVRALETQIKALGRRVVVVRADAETAPPSWFDAAERAHDVVILATRMSDEGWYRVCLRQADRLMLLVRRDSRPSRPMPLAVSSSESARRFRLVDIVRVDEGEPSGASVADWIEAANAHRVLHWRSSEDAARIARTMAGLSVGLVLSGGGARAYAHIGVIAALRAAKVPFDFIGGASMGAVVGASLALGWSDQEIDTRVRDGFVSSNPLGDLRLPVVAMTAGRRVEERLHRHFGSATIEDMPIPFFCVSTDLNAGRVRVHRTGLVREALRASIALPGILPPVVSGDAVLVDGAVLDNFPIETMADLHRGPNVGVDVTRQRSLAPHDFIDPPNFLQWVARYGLGEPPPIASLLMRAGTVQVADRRFSAQVDGMIMPELADVEMRDWRRYTAAVEAGHEAAMRMLAAPPARLLATLTAGTKPPP